MTPLASERVSWYLLAIASVMLTAGLMLPLEKNYSSFQLSLACWRMVRDIVPTSEIHVQYIKDIPKLCRVYEEFEKIERESSGVNTSIPLLARLQDHANHHPLPKIAKFIKDVCNWWPPRSCNYCEGFTEIPRYDSLSESEFISLFLRRHPFIVRMPAHLQAKKHGARALAILRQLYMKHGGPDDNETYQSRYEPIDYEDVYAYMKQIRSFSVDNRTHKKQYFGWVEIRKDVIQDMDSILVSRPAFISPIFWTGQQRWVFLGKGNGIVPHIDDVYEHGTWQYQLAGTKRWTLMPRSQCANRCTNHSFTVSAGEVFVLDTTRWWHGTECLSSENVCAQNASYGPSPQTSSKDVSCAAVGGDYFLPICPDTLSSYQK